MLPSGVTARASNNHWLTNHLNGQRQRPFQNHFWLCGATPPGDDHRSPALHPVGRRPFARARNVEASGTMTPPAGAQIVWWMKGEPVNSAHPDPGCLSRTLDTKRRSRTARCNQTACRPIAHSMDGSASERHRSWCSPWYCRATTGFHLRAASHWRAPGCLGEARMTQTRPNRRARDGERQ